ncbi:hypothetical protein TS71_07975 [Mycolicibacterium neoaurum]|nr:hypothetical protein D174_16880 [Mycolicibacterium neoaurum VKM Ac-1815D]KJQ51252.1 hypothetical protein TS71_07975 [Mycolicibacterium neoaurum]
MHPSVHDSPSILSKAFELLRAFNQTARVMTLSELARASDLPKSTVHRLLARLIELDVVEQSGHGYRLGVSLLKLSATTPVAGLRELAAPHLSALLNYTRHPVRLGILRGLDVVCVEKLSPRGPAAEPSEIGSRWPATCTALGKALLAHDDPEQLRARLSLGLPRMTPRSVSDVDDLLVQLRRTRANGLAYADGEARLGVACIAAPILVHPGSPRVVAALSVSFPSGTADFAKIEGAVRHSAGRLSADAATNIVSRERWLPVSPEE